MRNRIRQPYKTTLKLIGLGSAWGVSLVMVITFLVAYYNSSKTVLVTINEYGEAHIEFILLLILFPLITFTVLSACKRELEGLKR